MLIHFDQPFSRQTGEDFIAGLARDLGQILSISVGAGFVFGYKRGGNVQLLKRSGAALRFGVHALPSVSLNGRVVSSTRIRAAIIAGELDLVSQMLAVPDSLAGPVIEGDHLGRELRLPNRQPRSRRPGLPPKGVYAVYAHAGDRPSRRPEYRHPPHPRPP